MQQGKTAAAGGAGDVFQLVVADNLNRVMAMRAADEYGAPSEYFADSRSQEQEFLPEAGSCPAVPQVFPVGYDGRKQRGVARASVCPGDLIGPRSGECGKCVMPEYRQDPLSRRWVIIGGDRAGRPNEFVEETVRQSSLLCPFCAGNEAETPEAVATYPANGKQGWSVRVVPNKYPAVTPDASACLTCQPLAPQSVLAPVPGFGRHEVIIESPRHVASLSELTSAEAETVFRVYRDRLAQLKAERQFRYVQIFKNVGSAAGASLEHVHSQLVALPGVPEVIQQELQSSGEHFQKRQSSLLGDVVAEEVVAVERIVAETPGFVAFCPYASRVPYEVCVAPRVHSPRFEDAKPGELGELSRLMHDLIGRIERAAGQSAYNYVLHTQPFDMPATDHYHWHIEILPRLTKLAGFEWGTGCYINPLFPEAAAEHLRKV